VELTPKTVEASSSQGMDQSMPFLLYASFGSIRNIYDSLKFEPSKYRDTDCKKLRFNSISMHDFPGKYRLLGPIQALCRQSHSSSLMWTPTQD